MMKMFYDEDFLRVLGTNKYIKIFSKIKEETAKDNKSCLKAEALDKFHIKALNIRDTG